MALRSLGEKLRRLVPWVVSSRTRPPAASSEDVLFDPLKLESSVEAKVVTVSERFQKQARLREEAAKKRIWKNYRDAGLYIVGSVAFFCSCAAEVLADDAKPVNAEDSRAVDVEEAKATYAEVNRMRRRE